MQTSQCCPCTSSPHGLWDRWLRNHNHWNAVPGTPVAVTKLHSHGQIHKLDIMNLCVPIAPKAHNSTFIRKQLMSQHIQNKSTSVLPAHAVLCCSHGKGPGWTNACVTRQRHICAPEPPTILPASAWGVVTPALRQGMPASAAGLAERSVCLRSVAPAHHSVSL